jgi:hypothetical protein
MYIPRISASPKWNQDRIIRISGLVRDLIHCGSFDQKWRRSEQTNSGAERNGMERNGTETENDEALLFFFRKYQNVYAHQTTEEKRDIKGILDSKNINIKDLHVDLQQNSEFPHYFQIEFSSLCNSAQHCEVLIWQNIQTMSSESDEKKFYKISDE